MPKPKQYTHSHYQISIHSQATTASYTNSYYLREANLCANAQKAYTYAYILYVYIGVCICIFLIKRRHAKAKTVSAYSLHSAPAALAVPTDWGNIWQPARGPGEGGGRETGGNAVTARLAIPLSAVRVTKNKENTAAS